MGMGRDKAEVLKQQLARGVPTYVFLYSIFVPGKVHPDTNLWYRAKLIDFSLGKPKDSALIPTYYRDKDLALYCLIKDIEPIPYAPHRTPGVPGQAAMRHVKLAGNPIPENLVFADGTNRKICNYRQNRILPEDLNPEVHLKENPREEMSEAISEPMAMKVISLQEELLSLKDELADLRQFKDFYNKVLGADYLFSSEKFFETWIQENIHRVSPDLEILDRQPRATWPDGKFGRLDLLAMSKETKELVIIEVKTHKRSTSSGYDQYLRYTSWARKHTKQLKEKYADKGLEPTSDPTFLIVTDCKDEEMTSICQDNKITLIYITGGLVIEKVA